MKKFALFLAAVLMMLSLGLVTAFAASNASPALDFDLDGRTFKAGINYYIPLYTAGGASVDGDYLKDFTISVEVTTGNFTGVFKRLKQDDSYYINVKPRAAANLTDCVTVGYKVTCTNKTTNEVFVEEGTFDADNSWETIYSNTPTLDRDQGNVEFVKELGKVEIYLGSDARYFTYIDKAKKVNVVFDTDDTAEVTAIKKANYSADVDTLNFISRPSFGSGTLWIYSEKPYLYKVKDDGSFTRVNSTYESRYHKFEESTLGCYIMSDRELAGAAGSTAQPAATPAPTATPKPAATPAPTATPAGTVANPNTGAEKVIAWILAFVK